jgi:hypothetical protein
MSKEFSITNFLLVTGLSFLGFTGAMRVLDGVTVNALLYIGIFSIGLAIITFIVKSVFGLNNEQSTPD